MLKKFAFLFTIISMHLTCNEYDFPDPYPEVYETTEIMPEFLEGWHTYSFFFDPLLKERHFDVVVEVGVFLGRWTVNVAKQLSPGARFFAVDHWLGSEEHKTADAREKPWLDSLYPQFLSNIIHNGLTRTVVPVRMDSLSAAKKFKESNIYADLIYLDAAHDYVSVIQDLTAWFPLLKNGGVFCGDDWHWGGVQRAVTQFAKKNKLIVKSIGNFWHFEIPPESYPNKGNNKK